MSSLSLFDPYLESDTLAACFAGPALLQHMLAFEAALAHAEGELGIVPTAAAEVIVASTREDPFDLAAIARDTLETSSPAIALVAQLTAAVAAREPTAAAYVHWGSTSQDLMDSALMRCCQAACAALDERLGTLGTGLGALAAAHRHTPMIARTLGQHAGPTTFGLKIAGWLNGIVASRERLRAASAGLPVQFGGASGTLAAFGARGLELGAVVAAMLALRAAAPWHTERSVVRELAAAVAGAGATAGKIATDVSLMMQTEVAELRESAVPGRGASSAMPHKRNPVAVIGTLAAARRVPGLLATLYGSYDHSHERAAGAWHAESRALAELMIAVGAALEQLDKALDGLEVDSAAMRRNLELTRGLAMAEAVALALAPAIGRDAAQACVSAACGEVRDSRRRLEEVLAEDPMVRAHLDAAALARAMDPLAQRGASEAVIDQALARLAASEDAGSDAAPAAESIATDEGDEHA